MIDLIPIKRSLVQELRMHGIETDTKNYTTDELRDLLMHVRLRPNVVELVFEDKKRGV